MELHLDPTPSSKSSAAGATSRIVVERGKYRMYEARIGKKIVGTAYPWHNSDNRFVMMEVAVHASFRRRGVATAMYSAIERDHGKQLEPACSLSDDGFEFWKRYRPASVANDLRHWRNQLLGARAVSRAGIGTIISASGGVATVGLDLPGSNGGTQTFILRRNLNAALRAAGGVDLIPAHLDDSADASVDEPTNDSPSPPGMVP